KVDAYLNETHAALLPKFRAAAGEYLLASQKGDPRRGEQRDGLSRAMVQRWREYLNNAGRAHHPVLSPFLAFAALPSDQFAAKAAALAEKVAANADQKKPINALVAKAFAGKSPESLADVAKRY